MVTRSLQIHGNDITNITSSELNPLHHDIQPNKTTYFCFIFKLSHPDVGLYKGMRKDHVNQSCFRKSLEIIKLNILFNEMAEESVVMVAIDRRNVHGTVTKNK